jgi:hypothetical protein
MNFQGIFLKFGRDCDITQLQEQGLVYCNTVNFFKDLVDDDMRGDEFETATLIGTRQDLVLEIWPVDKPTEITRIATSKLVNHVTSPVGNLYCLYAVDATKMILGEKFYIDERLKEKSESFLIIKDVPTFLRRLHTALDKMKYYWEHHMVEYVDFSNYYGERTNFQKNKMYEYQNEFRVFIQNDKFEIIQVEIGNISDISIKLSSSILDKAFFIKDQDSLRIGVPK